METLILINKEGRGFANKLWQNVNGTAKKKDFQFHIKLSLEGRLTTVKLLKSWCFEGLRVLRISVTAMIEAFFGGLKFSIPGYFWEGKFGTYFLG